MEILLVLGATFGILFVAMQILGIGISTVFFDKKKYIEDFWSTDESGMLVINKPTVFTGFFLTLGEILCRLLAVKHISKIAEYYGEHGNKYDNNFKEEKHADAYNKGYMKGRKKAIFNQARKDVQFGSPKSSYTVPAEAKIYQETYVRLLDAQNISANRMKELYKDESANVLTDSEFREFTKKSAA